MASIAQAKLAIDSNREYRKIQKQAAKKSLWGSIGRTIGGLAATVLTGGTAGPLEAGMMAAGGTFLGGAIGSNQARISGGKFHKGEREDLRDKLGPLGEANITAALQSGITTGIMQSAKIGKDVAAAKASGGAEAAAKAKASYGGLDFANSTASKAWKKGGEVLNYGKAVVGTAGLRIEQGADIASSKISDALDYGEAVVGTAGYRLEQAVDPIVGNIKGDLATMDPRFKEFRLDDWNQLKDPNTGEWLITPKEYKDRVMAANPKNFGLDVSSTGEWGDMEIDLWDKGYSVEDIDSIMSGEYDIVSNIPSIKRTKSTSEASDILDSLELIEEGPDFTVGTPDPTHWTTDEWEQHIRASRQLEYDSGRVKLWEQPNTGIWQGETNYDGTKTIWQGDFSTGGKPSVAPTGPRFNPETGEILQTYDPATGELVYPNTPDVGTDASTIYQNKLNNTNIK